VLDGAICSCQLHARGHEGIETRVANANERWARDQNFVFRRGKSITAHHNVVKLVWQRVRLERREGPGVAGAKLSALDGAQKSHRAR